MIDAAITKSEVIWLGILTYSLFAMACIGLWRLGSAAKERERREREFDSNIEREFDSNRGPETERDRIRREEHERRVEAAKPPNWRK